ncbi:cell wall hydrolase [Allopontixanthobacter confluentis]|nr:cell wall hydrolase [Allopontixanthobacter confluentis]
MSLPFASPLKGDADPADFRARLRRNARSLAASRRPRHRGRRLAAMAAAIAVPAMATPDDWQALNRTNTAPTHAMSPRAMPFETAGSSFPGSAFFYLEDTPAAPASTSGTGAQLLDLAGTGTSGSPGAAQMIGIRAAGPAAHAFLPAGSGIDKARALQCLASAVYYEAASETLGGQRAVAQVVLNRVAHPSYPNSICGVVYQGSERQTGCQFSFTCDGSLDRRPSTMAWARARNVAQDALSGEVYRPVGLATHYHTIWVSPYWAPSLDPVGIIGAHRFYRWRGNAGKLGAFRAAYLGSEPFAARSLRKTSDLARDIADPLALARAFDQARIAAEAVSYPAAASTLQAPEQRSSAIAPAQPYSAPTSNRTSGSAFAGDSLPAAGAVRPEYANSGRWKSKPK